MVKILNEYEGLTKSRLKTVTKKMDHCDFHVIFSHMQVHLITEDKELTVDEMQESALDLQPIQPNSIYIKCGVLKNAKEFEGKGDPKAVDLLAPVRKDAPIMKYLNAKIKGETLTHTINTESPVEDEYIEFPLTVKKDISFISTQKKAEVGWYNAEANILWICDLVHNPVRAEMLLDKAVSAVYEFQQCGSLDVITPIVTSFSATLSKRGYNDTSLWWTGFEDSRDAAYIDGQIEGKRFLEEELDNLIKSGVDIFFIRNLLQKENLLFLVERCEGKLNLDKYQSIQIPAHTSLEQEVAAIESYLTGYTKKIAKEFYTLADKAMKAKRIKR